MSVAIALHVLSAIVWIGGMFFALLILRPASAKLEPGVRLPLWDCVILRFFRWVWVAIALLLASGYWMIFSGWNGFASLPVYLHLMQGIGWVMVLVYLHVWFAPWRRFRKSMIAGDLEAAAQDLNQVRILVTVNLMLGLLNAIIGASGRYW